MRIELGSGMDNERELKYVVVIMKHGKSGR